MKKALCHDVPGLEPRNCDLKSCSLSSWDPPLYYGHATSKIQERPEWIRPLGIVESYYAAASRFGFYNTVQAAWLSSSEPINVDFVARAVRTVTSNLEILQTSVWKSSSFKFRLRKMESYEMDFAVTSQDVMKVFDTLLHTRFDMEQGPLWRARLVLDPLKVNEAVLLLSIHHCITDGTTNLVILRDILRTLNALYKNEKVNFEFRPVDPSLADELLQPSHVPFIIKEGFKEIFNAFSSLLRLNSFSKLKGNPGQCFGRTRVLADELSAELTSKLFKRCKEAQVTVNCCFLAAARMAMLKLRQLYSPESRKASINVENFVNLRRYLRPEDSEALGGLVSIEDQHFSVREKDFENFWDLAKRIQMKQTKHLKRKVPVKRQLMFYMGPANQFVNQWLTKKNLRNVEVCQIALTNMGNLEAFFPSKEENIVQVANYVRSVSDHNGPAMCTLSCQTLRGKFLVSMDHYTNKMTDTAADHFFKTLIRYLQSIAEMGGVPTT